MNTLTKRIISGLIFGAIVIGAIMWNAYTYFLFAAAVIVIGMNEFFNITAKEQTAPKAHIAHKVFSIAFGLLLFGLASCTVTGVVAPANMLLVLALPLIFLIRELWSPPGNTLHNFGLNLIALTWIVVPFIMATAIVYKSGQYDGSLLLVIFFLVWIYDSMAYFTGSKFGKRPLFKRVSPKKSIEGLIGGTVLTIGTVLILHRFLPLLSLQDAVILSCIAIIFGTLGDLTESLIKRSLNIKDSGNIMPGHGGILDRFDAVLLAMPAAAVFLLLF